MPRFLTRLNIIHLVGAALALLIAMLAVAQAHEYQLGQLHIDHPWARASAGPAPTGAAYLTIDNKGTQADRLIAVETPAAKRAEIHQSLMEGGVMKMRAVEGGLALPAGASTALAPGGYHVMLMGLVKPLKEGESFPMTLTFEKAGKVEVEITVEPIGYSGEHKMKMKTN
ncbi:copper chaperone PCu(A)C [Tistlia consotensis]|nr:copper chaperone PCu(A)C [Tistlia consotensis]